MAKHTSKNRALKRNKSRNALKKVHSVYDKVNPRKLKPNEIPLEKRRKFIKEARKAKYKAAKEERLRQAALEDKKRLKEDKKEAAADGATGAALEAPSEGAAHAEAEAEADGAPEDEAPELVPIA